ncbi:MAG TPA: patatin-like phospholipase family protein [Amycolatopsis sp.]|nr:patatin-like phospholipase family protein [Amycolatopsis sp.]
MADRKSVDLVLEGGGVKGIGLLGAVLVLYDAGYRFERIAGTSAGAIVASLVAAYQHAGKDLHELEEVMHTCDYGKFADGSPLHKATGPIGDAVSLLLHRGAHRGDYLAEWLGPLFEATGVTTFGDLRIDDPKTSLQDYQRYSLVVHVSDLSRRALVRLPWDYSEYGRTADDQPIVDAVRASMSIPFFFRPVEFATGEHRRVTWVDGGLLSNFPITVFDRTDGVQPRWPTWGVKLSGQPRIDHDKPIRSVLGLVAGSLETLMSDWNRYRLEDEGVNQRTVFVNTDGVSAIDFGLSLDTQKELFKNGEQAAQRFLRQVPPE